MAGLRIGMNGYDRTNGIVFYRKLHRRLSSLPGVEEPRWPAGSHSALKVGQPSTWKRRAMTGARTKTWPFLTGLSLPVTSTRFGFRSSPGAIFKRAMTQTAQRSQSSMKPWPNVSGRDRILSGASSRSGAVTSRSWAWSKRASTARSTSRREVSFICLTSKACGT